jgi:hypothetical protein
MANPIFDITKFEWLNSVWIRSLNEDKKLKDELEDFYHKKKNILEVLKGDKGCDLVNAASTRMRSLLDFEKLVDFKKERIFTKEEKEIAKKLYSFLLEKLGNNEWDNDLLLNAMKEFSKKENVPFKIIFFLLTGKEKGIGILELNTIFGKNFFEKNLTAND